ncbi:GNAT family N-acetyltransferase [Rhizobium sp. 2YAF20]|uniref:GNAT family N-acetyltransferase n=1 Tax=Rhizobium sp. 2YAF20 TaxID=3233027 RepID=UPI003F99CFC9
MHLLTRLQGLGIGTALLELWLSKARLANTKAVHLGASLANEGAVRFWQSRGLRGLALSAATGQAGRYGSVGRSRLQIESTALSRTRLRGDCLPEAPLLITGQ